MKYAVCNPEELYQLCNGNHWFTQGTNEQYEKLFRANENRMSLDEIATLIWACSDENEWSLDAIKDELTKTQEREKELSNDVRYIRVHYVSYCGEPTDDDDFLVCTPMHQVSDDEWKSVLRIARKLERDFRELVADGEEFDLTKDFLDVMNRTFDIKFEFLTSMATIKFEV